MDYQEMRRTIGAKLKELRAARGWTQAQVASQARIGRDFLGRAERGHREPSLFVLSKLATVLEVDPAFLLLPAGERTPPVMREIQALLRTRTEPELRWARDLLKFHLAHPQPVVRGTRHRLTGRRGKE
jgi:transcriptional regulator with XRE-family HTH domain